MKLRRSLLSRGCHGWVSTTVDRLGLYKLLLAAYVPPSGSSVRSSLRQRTFLPPAAGFNHACSINV